MTKPPEIRGVTPEEIWQLIESEDMWEGLELEPRYVTKLFVSNLVQRALARVIGQGPYGPVPIKCNEDGYLFVAGLGGGYTRNEVFSGSAPDSYGTPITFSQAMGRVDVFTFDNPCVIKRSRDGVVIDDEIELFKDAFFSFDCKTLKLWIKNKTAGATARYQLVGWF